MAAPNPAPTRRTPAILKLAMGMMVSLYRWTGGAIGGRMGPNPVLLLTTTGRKSNMAHTIPLSYFEADGTLFLVASNGGQPQHPAWYLNLLVHPAVTIQRGRSIQAATATAADADQRARL
jgi:F420H(2)-dependent quinone reductase